MKIVRFLLITFISLGSYAGLYAQVTTSQISGKVIDAKGEALPGVSVSVVNTSTGTKYGASTNADGRYTLTNINPGGPYTITVTYVGFTKQESNDVNLGLGSTTLNFAMQQEATALKEVVVSGANRTARRNGAGTNISQAQIKTLPSLSRSLQDLTRVTPQSNNNSFLGTNFRYNNVTLDGAINNDAIGFSPSQGGQTNTSGQPGSSTRTSPVSLDAIQDIQVYLAPYDVKIGNFTGGSINAVTRSGTNKVSGSVYGFGRNSSFIGPNNAGDGSKEPKGFHEYQTGVRLGFPIIKDKLFFFTNEEITRRNDPIILGAGSPDISKVIDLASAQKISDRLSSVYGIDAGTYNNYKIFSNSNKFFNRLDWNINDKNQLSIRNNTITSEATNLERDQQNFRFGGIDYKQTNNQSSTVAELKSRVSNNLSNSFIAGYSDIHDYRDPLSNAAVPQLQITGLTSGTTIFAGTDREASIFNMKQKTLEFTDNLTWTKGNHTFTFGTHNELYNITYGFVNSWNGRVDYASIADFLNNNPSRVRTNYNYSNNSRDNIMSNPPAEFKVNMYSLYAQDDIQIGDKLKLSPGIRFDLADLPNMQPLSDKTINAPVDPNYGTTYTYTQPKNIKNDFFGKVQVSPRLGFNYDVKGDQSVILRGGTGLFTGRIPFAWLGYAYYNNGVTYGAYDNRSSSKPFAPGSDPISDGLTGNGEAGFVAEQGVNTSDAKGATQVDLIDNNFKMPQAWRSSLGLDYTTSNQWKFTVEGIYTKVIKDLQFQQVNYVDNPTYFAYDTQHQQPIYSGSKINPLYTNAYLLSNTDKGYRYSITGQVSRSFPFGLGFMAAYTYGQSKDITNGIRNSMESNWQLNQALNPNSPQLTYSNFDVRNRIVSSVNYRLNWNKKNKYISNFSLFVSAQSGAPFSYGFVNATIDGTGQQVSLVYIPNAGETSKFFADIPGGKTAVQQASEFDNYINNNKYLNGRRGDFTERNGGRTPWNTQADFRFSQDFVINKKHTVTFTYDIVNLTNLLNKDWGIQYFSPNTFNSMAGVGLKQTTVKNAAGATVPLVVNGYPAYTWSDPGTPYSKDFFASRYQMQLGLRYSF
ncbi:TonB-dependent receptor [Pedobacter sp. HMF7647]|uniref:TonB-dependent receptor n=1 Tax=Hufsiella arboris TaxID=2695275 RepID=A0A7K1YF96_9SPHI|nr:carboxypeptidase regulatory-like domain-containing protein [Hufsiella arboris]MXV53090.1 TonB-dependent receptor [Hufsiella arboris]